MNMIKSKMQPVKALESYSKLSALEGIVLLKNDDVLPLHGKKVAVFGRIQNNYYKSGTGSGGLVNVNYVPNLMEALSLYDSITIDQKIKGLYEELCVLHPFDEGSGQWASEPWAQKEFVLPEELIKESSKHNDVAVIIFGRTAGEDKDNYLGKGSYYLSDDETLLLENVSKYYEKVVVILNCGNAMDLAFVSKYNVSGLIFAFHGGMYGALALADILVGTTSPSGKLPFTISKTLESNPAHKNFGKHGEVIYEEDIYVGYRYYETFAKEEVLFPFGFGLSYTTFTYDTYDFDVIDKKIKFSVKVKNIGKTIGKEVIQIYVELPQGKLGKPLKTLVAFEKTNILKPNQEEIIKFELDLFKFASYDDYGYIYKAAYVLEKGTYKLFAGPSARDLKYVNKIMLVDNIITEKLKEINPPRKIFKVIKPTNDLKVSYVDVSLRTSNYLDRIKKTFKNNAFFDDKNYHLKDVVDKKITIDEFIDSLTDDEMIFLSRGEGMSSPKVTAGTAAAFGGVTDELLNKGIPIACAADGPSGIRMDSGYFATSLPIGTSLASSFNHLLIEELYYYVGQEMENYQIDLLLGPGMNIIRHPLNGRNFEYFSEDPLLTGIMATAVVKGLNKAGASGSLKHLYANNQETDRFNVNALISERAQREIYLKGFEIAIKSGYANAIMTSYNPVNSIWSASNYDVNKLLVRDEWKFKGIIITDWWAKMNDFEEAGTKQNTKAMLISQNDIYMVVENSFKNSLNDNTKISLEKNLLTRWHLKETSKHIVNYLLTTKACKIMHGKNIALATKGKKWFKTNQKLAALPLLDNETSNTLFDNKDDKNVLLIKNKKRINIYHYLKTKQKDLKEYTLSNINIDKIQHLSKNVWDPVLINLTNYVDKSNKLKLSNFIEPTEKFDYITYLLDVDVQAKYIFEIFITSTSNELAQIPFSILIDGEHKTTLTTFGNQKEAVLTKAFVIIKEGKHFITFKFNASGIFIHEIKCMRHG